MSSLCGKVETEVELKCSAQQFFEFKCDRPHHIANVVPDKFAEPPCTLVEGEWGKVGSIIIWHLVHDGKPMFIKEVIQEIDRNNYSMSFKLIDGTVFKEFKSFVARFDVRAKSQGEEGSIVHWTYHYEKLHHGIADPQNLLDLIIQITRGMDAHLAEGN